VYVINVSLLSQRTLSNSFVRTTDSVRYTVVYDSLTLADDFLQMVDKIMYVFIVDTMSKPTTG
jgi:hypothetical protein